MTVKMYMRSPGYVIAVIAENGCKSHHVPECHLGKAKKEFIISLVLGTFTGITGRIAAAAISGMHTPTVTTGIRQ